MQVATDDCTGEDVDRLVLEITRLGIVQGGELPFSLRAARLVPPAVAADFLGLEPRTLWLRQRFRCGPSFYRLSARTFRYRIADLGRWLRSRGDTCGELPALPTPAAEQDVVLRHDEAAAYLGVSAAQLWRYRLRRIGPPICRVVDGSRRFRIGDVERWLVDQRINADE